MAVAELIEATSNVRVVLQSDHQTSARERVENRVALRRIQAADFHGSQYADLIAGTHREQERLQFVEARVEHQ
jgi:hypothetical protein